jgi:hypothetical protein
LQYTPSNYFLPDLNDANINDFSFYDRLATINEVGVEFYLGLLPTTV